MIGSSCLRPLTKKRPGFRVDPGAHVEAIQERGGGKHPEAFFPIRQALRRFEDQHSGIVEVRNDKLILVGE